MREILFRGKRADNGEWEYGDLWCNPYGKRVVCIVSPINDQGTTGGNEVIPETVSQFTGLTDRNGRKIFEGDIILYHHKVNKLVPCEDATQKEIQHYGLDYVTGLGLAYRPTKTIRYKGYVTIDNLWGVNLNLTNNCKWWLCEKNGQLTSVEIIGNIYDNPELLGRMVKHNG